MRVWICIVGIFLCASCSLTRRLVDEEVLYRGVKRIKIEMPKGVKLSPRVRSNMNALLRGTKEGGNVMPSFRATFPIGLWVWNWRVHREKGLKHWLQKRWATPPMLLSAARPDVRLQMAEAWAMQNGFFRVTGDYNVHYKQNPRKAKVSYVLNMGTPYLIDTLTSDNSLIPQVFLSQIKSGTIYSERQLAQLREEIAGSLRNTGYFYFQSSYLEYLIDTTVGNSRVKVALTLKPDVPKEALLPYEIRQIHVELEADKKPRDTLACGGVYLSRPLPPFVRSDVVVDAVKMCPQSLYSEIEQQRTQASMGQLGIFRYSLVQFRNVDSLHRKLDVNILADYAPPISINAEFSVASASNDLMGPGLSLSVTNRNLFRRANHLTFRLNGSYEWQLGRREDALVNSYDLGAHVGLSFPRLLLAERTFVDSDYGYRTHFVTGLEWQARSGYFRLVSWRTQMSWEFNSSLRRKHLLTPLRITYSHLQKTSQRFDSTLIANPTLALSFRDQFVISTLYSYTYTIGEYGKNGVSYQFSVSEAGNVLSAIRRIMGMRVPDGRFMGIQYSQFLRGECSFIVHQQLSQHTMLAFRLFGGIGWAYGNSDVMPYAEQFYIGGANSLRAFRIRSIGPGSYQPIKEMPSSYLDRTGNLKMEVNFGYRFSIYGRWHGAVFMDAGNVWLLRKELNRPGGVFKWDKLWQETALGTGCGIRYDLTYLVLRVDLGVALHAPYATRKSGYFNIPRYNFDEGLVLNIAVGYPF